MPNGFHACENPLDVLDYYDLVGSRFARVEQSGDIDIDENKTTSAKIKVEVELTLPQFIKSAVDYAFQKISFDKLIADGKNIEGVNASLGDNTRTEINGLYGVIADISHDSSVKGVQVLLFACAIMLMESRTSLLRV